MEQIKPNEISAKTLKRAQKIGHELWRKVHLKKRGWEISMGIRTPNDTANFKPLDPNDDRNLIEKLITLNNEEVLRFVDPEAQVNIAAIGFAHIPEKFKKSTTKSLNVCFAIIDQRFFELKKEISPIVLNESLTSTLLKMIAAEIKQVRDILKKQQLGQEINAEERDVLQSSWVMQVGDDIHFSWMESFPDQEELQKQFSDLDAFEKDKDIVFLEAAVRARIKTL